MKKLLVVLTLALVVVLAFAGCSKKGTCAFCKKEDVKVTTVEANGEKADFCDDCKDFAEAAAEMVEKGAL